MTHYTPELLETFARIGLKLMAAREANLLSLDEISARTRINPSFLEMIEQGDLESLPNLAFVKGFIRNFIQALRLEDPSMEADIQALTLDTAEHRNPVAPPSHLHLLDQEPDSISLWKVGLILVLVAAVVGLGFFMYSGNFSDPSKKGAAVSQDGMEKTTGGNDKKQSGQAVQGSDARRAASQQGSAVKPLDGSKAPEARKPEGAGTLKPSAPQAPATGTARKALNLTIRGLERTWVRLKIDGRPPVDVLIEARETERWEAEQEIRLIVGKSQGVAVQLNGEDIVLSQEPNLLIPEMVLNKLALLKLEN